MNNNIALIKQLINDLNEKDREILYKTLKKRVATNSKIPSYKSFNKLLKNRFKDGIVCTKCGCCEHISKNGKTKAGIQRYKCKDCGQTFTITNKTIFYSAKKDVSTYQKYIHLMMEGASLRKCQKECGISLRTSFLWRQKILDTFQNIMDKIVLNGVVEMDETFFDISYKGSRKIPRKPHKRGGSVSTRGISKHKVCVACGINNDGLSISKISNLGRISTNNLQNVFNGHVAANSIICSDENSSYIKFSNNMNCNILQFNAKYHSGNGLFNIQHINNYHSRLKRFLAHFNGVSTKYLNNYLLWNNFVVYGNGTENDLFNHLINVVSINRNRTIQNRDAIPVLNDA